MNESKWTAVLTVLVERRLTCRIKLLFNDYAADEEPGGAVVTAYDQLGKPHYLEPHLIWHATPGYWETGSIGPFRPRDIEWLALPSATLEGIRPDLPTNLKVVMHSDDSVILGYEFE